MKRLALLITLPTLLAACGGAGPAPPRASPGIPATSSPVTGSVYATATVELTSTPLPTSPPGSLPVVIDAFSMGHPPQACVGGPLDPDPETGHLYTSGYRPHSTVDDSPGNPCLSVIDPATDTVLNTLPLPFKPQSMHRDGETFYVIGWEAGTLVVANADTGQIVAQESIGIAQNQLAGQEPYDEYGMQALVRDGWAYINLPGAGSLGSSGTLYLIPLRAGTGRIISDVDAFDLANDGRFAVAGGQETTTVRVYAGTDARLLAEREIGPGKPGSSLAFDGQTDRIFVPRQRPGGETSPARHFVDVIDATSLETVNQVEEHVSSLTVDPRRGRVYGQASGSRIVGFDAASGRFLDTLFTIPQPAQGLSAIRPGGKLPIDPITGRVAIVYQDFDGDTWVASFDPATGAGVADIQVPRGAPWAQDPAHGWLYFAGRDFLLGLDATTLRPVWRMALSRAPVSAAIAPDSGVLFVGDAGGDVHVLDLPTHAPVRLLPGVGGYVDVDTAHGWLYAGDEFTAGVSVYELATLEQRGIIPQPGRPTASPADAQVYILEEDVYTGNGTTLAVIENRTARNAGCNGCIEPTGVVVDPRSGLTHVTTYGTWVGKPGPTSHVVVDPGTGRAFVARTTGGYRVIYTLAAYEDLTLKRPLAWRDGLYGQPLYNPATGHLYLSDGARLLVLEDETLDIVGWLYPSEREVVPAIVDARNGRIYLLADSQVLVLEGSGGQFETPPPRLVTRLPGPPEGIVPLPNGILFVRAYDRQDYTSRLYRSTNGGQLWEEIQGGLPGAPNDLSYTPNGTLYAAAVPAAWRAETESASWGEGVYRSDDIGITWTPFSQGLVHLRVSRIHTDTDGRVALLATGTWPEQPDWPVPTIWQLGAEGRWSQVQVSRAGSPVSPDGTVSYTYTQAIDAAWHALAGEDVIYRSWGDELQRSIDGGMTWETIGAGPADYGVQVFTGLGKPPAIYWLTWDALYRSIDGAASWARLAHPALADSGPSAVAVGQWGDEETLFVGTQSGDLLVLPVSQADWHVEEMPTSSP